MAKVTITIDGQRFSGELTPDRKRGSCGVVATVGHLKRLAPLLKNDGVSRVRLWATIDDSFPSADFDLVDQWHAAGFNVLVTCTPPEHAGFPSAKTVVDFFKQAVKYNADLSLGNEVEGDKYFDGGNVKKYVTDFLKPASETIGNDRKKICGSVGYFASREKTIAALRQLVDNHATELVDAYDVHPYERNPDRMRSMIGDVANIADVVNKPFISSEFNGSFPQQQWINEMPSIFDAAREVFDELYFYRSVDKGGMNPTQFMYDGSFNPGPNYTTLVKMLKA